MHAARKGRHARCAIAYVIEIVGESAVVIDHARRGVRHHGEVRLFPMPGNDENGVRLHWQLRRYLLERLRERFETAAVGLMHVRPRPAAVTEVKSRKSRSHGARGGSNSRARRSNSACS